MLLSLFIILYAIPAALTFIYFTIDDLVARKRLTYDRWFANILFALVPLSNILTSLFATVGLIVAGIFYSYWAIRKAFQ